MNPSLPPPPSTPSPPPPARPGQGACALLYRPGGRRVRVRGVNRDRRTAAQAHTRPIEVLLVDDRNRRLCAALPARRGNVGPAAEGPGFVRS